MKLTNSKLVIVVIIVIVLSFCTDKSADTIKDIYNTDKEFSNLSVEIGFAKAFIEFAHPDAVMLRENSMPIVGKEAVSGLFTNAQTEGIHFTWEPVGGDIAASGELGYTYGIFTIKVDTTTQKGTYVSVWKKDSAGNWKYVLDSGNEGIGEVE
ncbi:MAG: hypothetical protein HQ541_18075 [Mariniphaga sp.]|nr:hypothetical protein [Mariniphaga sp.]